MSEQTITILGGGIAGLATATALAQAGRRVTVIEQAPEITEVGAGLQISPNGAAALGALGVFDALSEKSVASRAVVLRDYRKGRQVLRMDLTGRGHFLLVHRADLVDVLFNAANAHGVEFRLGTKVASVDLSGDAPKLHFDDGSEERVDLLIGADGGQSKLRQTMLGDTNPPFTGQVAWRAIVPVAKAAPEAQVFLGKGKHLVCYPLRDGKFMNLVGVEERADWAQEGWSHKGDPSQFRATFAEFGDPVRSYLNTLEDVGIWGLFRHPVAQDWYANGAYLIGDAAHPTLPFLAQGANLALEDAWLLSRTILRDIEPATFSALRRARVTRAINAANANARNYHLRNWFVRNVAHTGLRVLGAVNPGFMPDRFRWLYDYDVTQELRE